jgi:hypothetical protein
VAGYKVSVARSVRKGLLAIDRQLSLRIIRVLEALADNPRPHGCTKLEGASRLWRSFDLGERNPDGTVFYRTADFHFTK